MANPEYSDLTTFRALSLLQFTSQLPKDHDFNQNPPARAAARFSEISVEIQKTRPSLLYNENLVEATIRLAAEQGVSTPDSIIEEIGNTPGTWAPFPDTIQALKKLRKYYEKLIILSNIDNTNMARTVSEQLAGAIFDATYTAQDIGSYKPSHANFQYLFTHAKQDLGIDFDRGDLLHVARSIRADHIPSKQLGLRSVWISRGGEQEARRGMEGTGDGYESKVAFEWRFDTVGELADEVERQFEAKQKRAY